MIRNKITILQSKCEPVREFGINHTCMQGRLRRAVLSEPLLLTHTNNQVCNNSEYIFRERSGRVLDSRSRGCGFEPHRHHCVRHINPCLVLVQPRKTCPDITEKLLTGT